MNATGVVDLLTRDLPWDKAPERNRIHARNRGDTNIRTGPKAAGKGSSKGKKSPKETKRSKGAGKGSGSKKERRQRSFGSFGCIACLDLY